MRMKLNDFTFNVPSVKLQLLCCAFSVLAVDARTKQNERNAVRGNKQMPVFKFEMYNSPQKGEEGRTRR